MQAIFTVNKTGISDFKHKFFEHLQKDNKYRKDSPDIFSTENYDLINLKENIQILKQPKGPETNIISDNSVRRIKKANYGNWYLSPTSFNRKVSLLNSELSRLD